VDRSVYSRFRVTKVLWKGRRFGCENQENSINEKKKRKEKDRGAKIKKIVLMKKKRKEKGRGKGWGGSLQQWVSETEVVGGDA